MTSPTLAPLPPVAQAPTPSNSPAATDPGFQPAKLPELQLAKPGASTTPAAVDTPPEVEATPPSPEAAEAAAAEKASGGAPTADAVNAGTLPPQGLPALPLPALTPPGTEQANAQLPTISLPEIQVDQETAKPKPKVVTWQTRLAPSIIPPKTNFNYKRAVLPDVIYRDAYTYDNQHLPKRITRTDYENLLFASVAKNDIEATRALLNAGTGLQATNAYGETPLAAAKRAGAVDVAALLVARGAR